MSFKEKIIKAKSAVSKGVSTGANAVLDFNARKVVNGVHKTKEDLSKWLHELDFSDPEKAILELNAKRQVYRISGVSTSAIDEKIKYHAKRLNEKSSKSLKASE